MHRKNFTLDSAPDWKMHLLHKFQIEPTKHAQKELIEIRFLKSLPREKLHKIVHITSYFTQDEH